MGLCSDLVISVFIAHKLILCSMYIVITYQNTNIDFLKLIMESQTNAKCYV